MKGRITHTHTHTHTHGISGTRWGQGQRTQHECRLPGSSPCSWHTEGLRLVRPRIQHIRHHCHRCRTDAFSLLPSPRERHHDDDHHQGHQLNQMRLMRIAPDHHQPHLNRSVQRHACAHRCVRQPRRIEPTLTLIRRASSTGPTAGHSCCQRCDGATPNDSPV